MVEETLSSGRSVAEIARGHEVDANQVFDCADNTKALNPTAQD
ncbi:hypothetical protein [Paraburkholderia sp. CI3]